MQECAGNTGPLPAALSRPACGALGSTRNFCSGGAPDTISRHAFSLTCVTEVEMKLPPILAAAVLLTLTAAPLLAADANPPIRPVGRDGHVLNLDFETGTLADWTAQGDA